VVLDIDGVLDKQIFGYPSTTAAGMRALGLLHSHGRAVALNTARTVREGKEYCQAYGFVGGAARLTVNQACCCGRPWSWRCQVLPALREM